MTRLDVVVFGASGFTGQHAVEELARVARRRALTWAVAGRNREKLLQLLNQISQRTGLDLSSTPLLVANVQDEQSLQNMSQRARVLVNCCGPYTLYGEPVVKACILSGTHYVDVTGEPNFVELMQLKYGQAARDAGVYVISACGFESIPADLGVIYLQQNFDGVLNSVECYVAPDTPSHSVNYGTWHSMVYSLAHFNEIPAIRKKLYPTPLPEFNPKLKYRLPLHKRFGGWCLPFPCNDSASVRRTQRFFYERDGTRPAQINTYIKFDSLFLTLGTALVCIFLYVMSQFEVTRKMLLSNFSRFSLGLITEAPSEEVVRSVGYAFHFYGAGWDVSDAANVNTVPPRKVMVVKVSGTNPGYGMTVVGLLYSALAILDEPQNMPPGGGVLTPGIAFAKTNLIKNLQENGVNFEIVQSKQHRD